MSASRLYKSTGKPWSCDIWTRRTPSESFNGSTLSELRAAEVGYNLRCRIGSFVRKVELLNTNRVSETLILSAWLFRDYLLLPKEHIAFLGVIPIGGSSTLLCSGKHEDT